MRGDIKPVGLVFSDGEGVGKNDPGNHETCEGRDCTPCPNCKRTRELFNETKSWCIRCGVAK